MIPGPVNIQQLEAFVSAATLKSFGAAATRLYLTQPSISLRVKALEDALGVKLFDRVGHGVRLTSRGRELLPHAERVLESVHTLQSTAHNSTAQAERIRIGTVSSMATAWVPYLMNEILTRFQSISFDLVVESSLRLRERLLAGEIDMAIIMGEIRDASIRNLPLGLYQMQWIASPSMPLPRGSLGLEQVARYPIVTHGRESTTYKSLEIMFKEAGAWPVRLIASDSDEAIVHLVEMGTSVGVVNYACLEERPSPRIRILQCDIPLPTHPYFAAFHIDSIGKLGMQVAQMAQQMCRDPSRLLHHKAREKK
ncbi:LysR family transcriptional regulator [Bordetella petrii]|nr:LysR family transcriptional regulator [Bordetella petrii]